jgi:ADP-heptose:LPS heptosyltransferase
MLIEIGKSTSKKWILLGGKEDASKAQQIAMALGINCIDLTSKLSLNQSATVVKYAHKILTPDTGLMHIAAAFKKEIISVWGNTIPQFGMNALLPEHCINIAHIFEVEKLNCRPCSKIGYKKCPKKHFNCMQMQNVNAIVKELEK